MTNHSQFEKSSSFKAPRAKSRGIALVTTLLLLSLMVAMTLAMVIAVSSDTLITRYYRNFRASFYAADSGVNIARQYMLDQLEAAVPTGAISPDTQPITINPATVAANVLNLYGSSGATANRTINLGQGANSWPGSFQISSASLTESCQVLPSTDGTCAAPTGTPTEYQYTYTYALSGTGNSLANQNTTINDSGSFTLNVPVSPGSTTLSFSAWGTFLDQYTECSSPFAPGTLTGPFFTNGAWTFESGSYTFTGSVGSVSPTFGYYYGNGNCAESANPSYKQNGTTIAPSFQDGYKLGQTAVALPTNDFNQKEAVVDGLGDTWSTPTQTLTAAQQDAAMSTVLKTVDGTATPYPSAGTTNPGVYLPYSQTTVGGVTTNTMTGGGIYVEGDAASVVLTASNATNGDAVQVMAITQGTSPDTTVTTITIDPVAQTTTVSQAATTSSCTTTGSGSHRHTTCTNTTNTTNTAISGVPENQTGTSPSPATMLYVDGNIDALSGPGQGVAAIQNGSAMTITAADNVVVTGDVLYKTEPVTTTQNQTVGGVTYPNVDTLIPGNNNGQVLGIFTATGNVQMDNQQSNGNIELDASIAMISQGGSGGWTGTSGDSINTVTLVGGRVANTAKACYCNSRNLYFDQRFASGAFAPPWFPSTTIATGSNSVGSYTAKTVRTAWAVQNY